jgi:hypothetical protein
MIDRFDWGSIDSFGSAAYWVYQARNAPATSHQLATTLEGEVVACLLGGHGMPAEIGLAAFRALSNSGLVDRSDPPSAAAITSVLEQPLKVRGRSVRYRFPRQKARYVAAALAELRARPPVGDAHNMRHQLMTIPGIGLKTSSWIVRNWAGSTDVAIIDIHVLRAGQAAGFLELECQLPRDYLRCEEAFLMFAATAGVCPIALDTCIWSQLHELRGLAPEILARVTERRLRREADSPGIATERDPNHVLTRAL